MGKIVWHLYAMNTTKHESYEINVYFLTIKTTRVCNLVLSSRSILRASEQTHIPKVASSYSGIFIPDIIVCSILSVSLFILKATTCVTFLHIDCFAVNWLFVATNDTSLELNANVAIPHICLLCMGSV